MKSPTKRPPHREGGSEAMPGAQGQLALKGGRSDATGTPRVFARPGEKAKRCSFRCGEARFSGLTPYEDRGMATAFAKGALAVAKAVHDHIGPSAIALVLNGTTGIVRWRLMTPAMHGHIRRDDPVRKVALKAFPAPDDGDEEN